MWSLVSDFRNIPVTLEESDFVGGVCRLKVVTRIILPPPGLVIVAMGIYSFITGHYYSQRPSRIYHYAGGDKENIMNIMREY